MANTGRNQNPDPAWPQSPGPAPGGPQPGAPPEPPEGLSARLWRGRSADARVSLRGVCASAALGSPCRGPWGGGAGWGEREGRWPPGRERTRGRVVRPGPRRAGGGRGEPERVPGTAGAPGRGGAPSRVFRVKLMDTHGELLGETRAKDSTRGGDSASHHWRPGWGNRWTLNPRLRFGQETGSRERRFKAKECEETAWAGTLMEEGTARTQT